ncbi:CoA-transferase family III domain-containing protein [Desarmillaria ectypa]|nr:CoA-transferase family III domain-containing protein [Desarmillaria ectypa]
MSAYSIPLQAAKLLSTGIPSNPLHDFPVDIKEAAGLVEYVGSDEPCMPINWRFAESIASTKGLEGATLNVVPKHKYGIPYRKIVIDTDHAQLYFISPIIYSLDGEDTPTLSRNSGFEKYFPNYETHDVKNVYMNTMCTTMYKTKDCHFYHFHALDIPKSNETELLSLNRAGEIVADKVAEYEFEAIETLMNVKYRQTGTIAHSKEEYLANEHGKAHTHIGLYELHHIPNTKQLPTWWSPVDSKTTPERPFFGLKIIDLTRIITGAVITRDFAEPGASVLRITFPGISDINWNAHLDLRSEEDLIRLRELVVVEGYRPGIMAKWDSEKMISCSFLRTKRRDHQCLRELLWWQHISDANTGVSYSFGRAMSVDEPVTLVWPNSDFCTGASGAIEIIQALIERAEKGGSYVVDLRRIPKYVWDTIYAKAGHPVFYARDNMIQLVLRVLGILKAMSANISKDEYFETRENPGVVRIRTVKPVLTFPDGVGSRPNGMDKQAWPADLAISAIV